MEKLLKGIKLKKTEALIQVCNSISELAMIEGKIKGAMNAVKARRFKDGQEQQDQALNELARLGLMCDMRLDDLCGLDEFRNYVLNNSELPALDKKGKPIIETNIRRNFQTKSKFIR